MAAKKPARKPMRPAKTAEGRENQLISLAIDLAERQLIDGSASSQTIGHFLKLASTREVLEQKRLENENLLLSAKIGQIQSADRLESLYSEALKAMKTYTGEIGYIDDDYED